MQPLQNWTPTSKLCFVTTGATAPFPSLIQSVLSTSTLHTLHSAGYTHLIIQHGTAQETFTQHANTPPSQSADAIPTIQGIDFLPQGLQPYFKLVQQSQGLVISHAGSGSILEALRYQVPLVVVPNTSLLDNHQEELAEAMERHNYLIRGDVRDLRPAIEKSVEFRVGMARFPPVTSGKHRETKSFAAIMDETMGFLD